MRKLSQISVIPDPKLCLASVFSCMRQSALELLSPSVPSQTLHRKCSDMEELLTSVSPQLVDEFAEDFFANRGRELLHDSKRWRVLNTWLGDPREHFRSVTHWLKTHRMHCTSTALIVVPLCLHDCSESQAP